MRRCPPRTERGVVLIITLIILVVASLIALSAQRNVALEERMAGNMLDRNLAFQAAEAALRVGEAAVSSNTLYASAPGCSATATSCTDGYYAAGAADDVPVWKHINWTAANSVAAPLSVPSGSVDLLQANPRYIVEQLDASTRTFRVTARATGGTAASVVVVQSVYVPK